MRLNLQTMLRAGVFAAASLLLSMSVNAQYCSISYTYAQCNSYNMYINKFSTTGGLANITNNNTGCGSSSNSYKFYNTMVHKGVQGTTVNFSVTIGSSYPQGVRIYVDWNGDGDFNDANETAHSSSSTISAGGTRTGSFTVPANATVGQTRMRVRSSYSDPNVAACGAENYGECEDYVFEVVPSCSVKFTNDPSDNVGCGGFATPFSATVQSADTFRWQYFNGATWSNAVDGPQFGGATTTTLQVKNILPSMTGWKYRLIGYNTTENCSVKSKDAELTVIPTSASSIIILPSDTVICKGQTVTMQTAFSKGGSTPQYQWVMNGVDIAGANGASYSSNSLSNNDIISVKFVSSQQCILPSVSNNVVFSVGEKYESKVDITVSYLGDNQYQFQAHPKNGGKAPLYQWFKNGKYIPGATGARYVAENIFHSDKIYVEMVSSDECVQNKVSASKSIGLDVSDITGTLGTFSVYPNPNSGRFTLTGDLTANTNTASIDIINTLGQNVYNSQVAVNNHKLQTAVELDSKLSNGMYTIKVTADGKTSSMRFMLNK